MSQPNLTMTQINDLKDHLLAIGWTEVYLSSYPSAPKDAPYHLVTEYSVGRTYSDDLLPRSFHFKARLTSGITVSWTLELTRYNSSTLEREFDVDRVASALRSIPDEIRVRIEGELILAHARISLVAGQISKIVAKDGFRERMYNEKKQP